MDDAVAVRLVERVRDLGCDLRRLIQRQRAFLEASGERLPIQAWHDQKMRAVGFADVVDAADVRMLERRDGARLALEARAEVRVAGDFGREDLDRDAAIEPCVAGFVDLAL